ncbi:unnamed protein product [Bursaphelenchus xylophilus]|uniref:(pine wood nematode) hypothetical protein n=1 Tax=Bursaphelenchus xylophilus TaxID=6326 RepID=A0A1I7RJB0_BURXY|nr:unnamed protein product [Bursaphelenchus xylophilus]CAG9128751.1 unnamed protein product [Bursaphelenchus xylophilus]
MAWTDIAAVCLPFYDLFLGILSYCLNILVIYLARTQANKSMAEYTAIILLNSVVDIIFNTTNLITRQFVDMQDGNLFMLNTGPIGQIPQPYSSMITFSWLFSLLLTVVTVPIQFLYRYSQLCLRNPLQFWHYVLIFGGFILAIALHCAAGVLVFETNPAVLREYEHLLRRNPLFHDNVPVFTLGVKDSPKAALHMLDCIFIVAVAYSIVIYCALKTIKKLRVAKESMSRTTLAAQRQLTVIMIIQGLNPLIIINTPIFVAVLFTLFNVTLQGISYFITPIIAFIPIVNSLSVICIVPSFRRFVLRQRKVDDKSTSQYTSERSAAHSKSRDQ